MEKRRISELVFILDESGSMGRFTQDTIKGFNDTIDEHRGKNENIITSVILFNTGKRVLYDRVNIDEVPVMTKEDYRPNSGTVLCDAVGETINNILCPNNATNEGYQQNKKYSSHIIPNYIFDKDRVLFLYYQAFHVVFSSSNNYF